jgi:hypothetical protein
VAGLLPSVKCCTNKVFDDQRNQHNITNSRINKVWLANRLPQNNLPLSLMSSLSVYVFSAKRSNCKFPACAWHKLKEFVQLHSKVKTRRIDSPAQALDARKIGKRPWKLNMPNKQVSQTLRPQKQNPANHLFWEYSQPCQ